MVLFATLAMHALSAMTALSLSPRKAAHDRARSPPDRTRERKVVVQYEYIYSTTYSTVYVLYEATTASKTFVSRSLSLSLFLTLLSLRKFFEHHPHAEKLKERGRAT